MMKLVRRLLFIVILGVVAYAAAIVFTPLPYLPINSLLKNSPDMFGHISGNINSGIEITDLRFIGKPTGEVSIKKVTFKHNGLFDYFFRNRLIIKDLSFEGVSVNFPQGPSLNVKNMGERIKSASYLIPPIPNKNISLIQMDNVEVKDVDIYIGESPTPTMGMPFFLMPLMKMKSAMGPGSLPGTPATESAKKTRTNPDFVLKRQALRNFKFRSAKITDPVILELFEIRDMSFVNKKFDLGSVEIKSTGLDLRIAEDKNQPPNTAKVHTISGIIKKFVNGTPKKGISLKGSLSIPHFVDLSLFDEKVTLKAFAPSAENPKADIQFRIIGLSLRDYFPAIAPLTVIHYAYKFEGLFAKNKPSKGSFMIGGSKFVMIPNPPMQSSMSPEKTERTLITAQHDQWKKIRVKLVVDSEVPGKIKIKLTDTGRIHPNLKNMIAKVWFFKPYQRLNRAHRKHVDTITPYFSLDTP